MSVEIIKNGGFDDTGYWDTQHLWSVSDGKGRYLMGDTPYEGEYLGQWVCINIGLRYRLTFDVDSISLSGTTYLRASVGGIESPNITEAGSYDISGITKNIDDFKFEVLGSGAQAGDEVILDNVSLIYEEISPPYVVKRFFDEGVEKTKIVERSEYQS